VVTVLVTGSAGAIGKACVERFLAEGDEVIAHARDAALWSGLPGVTPVSGDLLEDRCFERLASVVEGTELRAVVAAHGVAGSAPIEDCTEDFVSRVVDVNFVTIPRLFEVVSPRLEQTKGSFIAVASQAALTGEAGNIAYCAAKFAVMGWVNSVAVRSTDVAVHALCPGATNSKLLVAAQERFATAAGMSPEEYYQYRANQISVGRYGEPEEIAAAAAYLAGGHRRPRILAVTGGDVLY
jgi:NAD(P)-dependent dehydrogenase (short-subunit alcohol dehydrogenase family)